MPSLPPRRPSYDEERFDPEPPARKSNNTLLIVLAISAACVLFLCAGIGVFAALLWPAVQKAREAAQRSVAKNELKEIGIAVHNFHDAHNHLPPLAADGSDGPAVTKPISFHTALLPYVDQSMLYDRIDKSIPWDEAANKAAYSNVVRTFLSPQSTEHVAANGYALTHFVPNSQLIRDGRGIPFREVIDGLSSTILAGQVNTAFPAWGDPTNARDPANGFAGGTNAFGGGPAGPLVLMGDGSVRQIDANTAPDVAAALASPAGGEALPAEF